MAVEKAAEAIAENAHAQRRKVAGRGCGKPWRKPSNPPPCANPVPVTPSALPAADFQMWEEKGIPALNVRPHILHFLSMDPSA
jgi:hypothetical protein